MRVLVNSCKGDLESTGMINKFMFIVATRWGEQAVGKFRIYGNIENRDNIPSEFKR